MASGAAGKDVIAVLASPVVTNLLQNILSTVFSLPPAHGPVLFAAAQLKRHQQAL